MFKTGARRSTPNLALLPTRPGGFWYNFVVVEVPASEEQRVLAVVSASVA